MPTLTKTHRYTTLAIMALAIASFAAGCGKTETAKAPEITPVSVKVKTADESASLAYKLDYPAMVVSEQEAKVYAKTNGTIVQADRKVGDKISLGDKLFSIDDVNGSGQTQGFSAYQIKQAKLAAEQAATSYQMAQTNYGNLLISSNKDLRQAEIASEQARTGKDNLSQTTSEAYKSAQLAYETAKVATEQARLTLENRRTISGQTESDTATNAQLAAQTTIDGCGTILSTLNSTLELDRISGGNLPYSSTLGALDSQSLTAARAAYKDAKSAYDAYRAKQPDVIAAKLDAVLTVAQKTKDVADASKKVLENTPASASLPQSSLTGASLSSLLTATAGYQSQINAALAQINGAKQGLANIGLNNGATLDSLEKAYELAKQQEKIAAQNLLNLTAGNKAQTDNANFGTQSADNQLASIKTKLDTQIAVSKSQTDLARLQYENALTALQNLVDVHESIAPLSGTLIKKAVEEGATVSAGQLLAVVGTPERVKVQFFVDADHLDGLVEGLPVTLTDRDGLAASGTIISVTPQADAVTKRFMVEAKPTDGTTVKLNLGTIATVTVPFTKLAPPNGLLLPLAAVDVGQNGASIFIVDKGLVKRTPVTLGRIEGETTEVYAKDLADNAQIIVDGNKLVQEGDTVQINK